MKKVATTPFDDQKAGTSGLRKRVTYFQKPNYLENFVQSIFDCLDDLEGKELILGGDGRYYNSVACQTIIRMAAAAGYGRVVVGQNGLLSTPAVSHLIRLRNASGGIILSASHNPGGPDGDFGIKYNGSNGGPAPEKLTERIYERSKEITAYHVQESADIDLSVIGTQRVGAVEVEIVDPVAAYAELMEDLFDFAAIRSMIAGGFSMRFDAMHAATGPYAKEIFINRLGAASEWIMNAQPDESFGGGHPDPNLVYAKEIYDLAMQDDGPDLCAASDGDGDRNLIIGKKQFVSPSDSLAVLAANAHLVPAYSDGLKGVARSMPTSGAVDRVAEKLGLPLFETPTGWKFFGNLLDSGDISLCGEESAGTGSNHVREKDGVWAVLMWLNILAARRTSVANLMREHWSQFGRNYYVRHDFEEVPSEAGDAVMETIRGKLAILPGKELAAGRVQHADEFAYLDPVDQSRSEGQGLRILYEDGSRIIFRLSGTGTIGATLRVYIEKYIDADGDHTLENEVALASLIKDAHSVSDIVASTGKSKPDVIT